jgi:hypothetical protein
VHGVERPIAYARNHLPALVEVGKTVGERSMQIQTEEMRRAMGGADEVVPRRPGLMDAWIRVLDVLVRVLTFGRGRVVRERARGPVRWDGNLR